MSSDKPTSFCFAESELGLVTVPMQNTFFWSALVASDLTPGLESSGVYLPGFLTFAFEQLWAKILCGNLTMFLCFLRKLVLGEGRLRKRGQSPVETVEFQFCLFFISPLILKSVISLLNFSKWS